MAAKTPAEPVARDPEVRAIAEALSAPFDPKDVKYKPQMVKNNRALAMAYIDARLIQDRLDSVLGVENWGDAYKILPDGSVMCRLRIKLGDRWISKTDVGSPSEQPDVGDRLKAAFSDALKRAAVKFGIGRYLYRLAAQWVHYDPVKKQLTQLPQLPAFAIPKSAAPAKSAQPTPTAEPAPPAAPARKAKSEKVEEPKAAPPKLPTNGQELHRRLRDYDAKLASQKLCNVGALLAHVTQAGVKAGYTANMSEWSGPAIQFAVDAVKEFEQSIRPPRATEPRTAA
jgi:hypothetical protein